MHKWTVSVEDAQRLLPSTDFAYLSTWHREELAKTLANLPQPPLMGIAENDDYKLSMLDHALAEIGRRRTKQVQCTLVGVPTTKPFWRM